MPKSKFKLTLIATVHSYHLVMIIYSVLLTYMSLLTYRTPDCISKNSWTTFYTRFVFRMKQSRSQRRREQQNITVASYWLKFRCGTIRFIFACFANETELYFFVTHNTYNCLFWGYFLNLHYFLHNNWLYLQIKTTKYKGRRKTNIASSPAEPWGQLPLQSPNYCAVCSSIHLPPWLLFLVMLLLW